MSDTGQPGDGRRLPWSPITPSDATPPGASGSSPSGGSWQPTQPGAQAPVPAPARASAQPPAVPPTSAPDGSGGPGAGGSEGKKRPRWVLPVAIGGGLLVVAGVVVGVLLVNDTTPEAQEPLPAETVVLPSPTASVEPVAREATTAFATALPTTVLQYALQSSAPEPAWVQAGALEAYIESFGDGADGTFTVRSGQWAENQEAADFYAARVAELPKPAAGAGADATPQPGETATVAPEDVLPQAGTVRVDGERVGDYRVVDLGDGTGVAIWRNSTAVFRAEGPVEDVLNFYRAFPM